MSRQLSRSRRLAVAAAVAVAAAGFWFGTTRHRATPASAAPATDPAENVAMPPQTGQPSPDGGPDTDPAAAATDSSVATSPARPMVRYRNGKLVEDNTPPVILLSSEFGETQDGLLTVPAYVGDVSYLSAQLQTEAQRPIAGQPLSVQSARGNPVLVMTDHTDASGYIDFRVLVRHPGRDTLTVTAAGVSTRLVLDVQRPPSREWFGELDLRGVTPWDLLIDTPLDYGRDGVTARFPAALQAMEGKPVRLAGFMLPLESALTQRHFLLTANPPACLFHPPGGPTSVVDVQAGNGIENSLDAVVIEGRLRLVARSADGLIYRLENARLLSRG